MTNSKIKLLLSIIQQLFSLIWQFFFHFFVTKSCDFGRNTNSQIFREISFSFLNCSLVSSHPIIKMLKRIYFINSFLSIIQMRQLFQSHLVIAHNVSISFCGTIYTKIKTINITFNGKYTFVRLNDSC